ncbi:hypothetical protein DFH09DRAFT_1090834 [Mycena vulgaris]|nr:hypothetical protein DFH09DRAFT_1090834 [Mycena vulgaris]
MENAGLSDGNQQKPPLGEDTCWWPRETNELEQSSILASDRAHFLYHAGGHDTGLDGRDAEGCQLNVGTGPDASEGAKTPATTSTEIDGNIRKNQIKNGNEEHDSEPQILSNSLQSFGFVFNEIWPNWGVPTNLHAYPTNLHQFRSTETLPTSFSPLSCDLTNLHIGRSDEVLYESYWSRVMLAKGE